MTTPMRGLEVDAETLMYVIHHMVQERRAFSVIPYTNNSWLIVAGQDTTATPLIESQP